jgi:hypothetical protein
MLLIPHRIDRARPLPHDVEDLAHRVTLAPLACSALRCASVSVS